MFNIGAGVQLVPMSRSQMVNSNMQLERPTSCLQPEVMHHDVMPFCPCVQVGSMLRSDNPFMQICEDNLDPNIGAGVPAQFFDTCRSCECLRYGEARHPGPWVIRTFNPTQLLGREEEICKWPDGVWTGAETSHTVAAQHVIRSKFRANDVQCLLSAPVEVHKANSGVYRGKASGTALLSRFPMRPYPQPLDPVVAASSRFCDGVVHVGHGLHVYVCVVYGPATNTQLYEDPDRVFLNSILPGIQRASTFKGPAVITGDFNRNLVDCPFWDILQQQGWSDAAELAWERFRHVPEPTCKDLTRKSFLLLNREMTMHFQQCKTVEHYVFYDHPVLEAVFDSPTMPLYKQVWKLPRSFDDLMVDPELMEQESQKLCEIEGPAFQQALAEGRADDALSLFARAYENAVKGSAVHADGHSAYVPAGCFKRCQGTVVKKRPITAPLVRKAREGDLNVQLGQTSLGVRRHVTQGRRLQSLVRQMQAYNRNHKPEALQQCNTLWLSICHATGFHQGFQTWIMTTLGMFVPTSLPQAEYLQVLYEEYMTVVNDEVQRERQEQYRRFHKITIEDLAKGGGISFRAVKDKSLPPPSFLVREATQPIARQRWSKEGLTRLKFHGECKLQVGFPVHFQNQEAVLLDKSQEHLTLDRPVKCRDAKALVVTQQQTFADPGEMQQSVCDAWNQFWQAAPVGDQAAAEFVHSLSDCSACPYEPFQVDTWKFMLRGVKHKSARGACGFSMRDACRMPDSLLLWLFALFNSIENGMQWPSRLTLARVVMLAKPGEDNHNPLSVRPITILSVLYRLWSRFRSQQVLAFLGTQVPPQVGGVACRVSADSLTGLICDMLESAQEDGHHRCGLVVDLKKCFNLIPRLPLIPLMKKLGFPSAYIDAHQAMLKSLHRLVEVKGEVGEPQPSSCGVPEGCAFSVVTMVALTVLAADVIRAGSPTTEVTMFADNWGIIAQDAPTLQEAIRRLETFVQKMGLQISPQKSWTWGTSGPLRRQLQQVTVHDSPVPVKQNATDLGCDVSYTRQKCKKVAKSRMAKAVVALGGVRKRKLPRAFKSRMCATLGAGIAGYGSELQKQSSAECHKLRSAVAGAVGLDKSGANSWMVVNVTGGFRDPQVQLLTRKLKFYRRFFRLFPDRLESFLARLTAGRWKARNGITRQFAEAFSEVGWRWGADGWMYHTSGVQCNWLHDPIPYVVKCIHAAWPHHVCSQIKRKHFDVSTFDGQAFHRMVSHRDPKHQGMLQMIASGKHVTKDALCHYTDKDRTCPFCDQDDSKWHQLFECPGLQEIRDKHQEAVQWAMEEDEAVWAFALVPADFRAWELRCLLQKDFVNSPPAACDEVRDVFVDGSAFLNEVWDCCLGGAAFAQVDIPKAQVVKVHRELLPFAFHNSYRAECFSILMVLREYWKVNVYSDCLTVVNQLQQLLDALASGGKLPIGTHSDLWIPIADQLRVRSPGDVKVFKVKAHQDWQSMAIGLDRTYAFFNCAVDEAAKSAVTTDFPHLLQAFQVLVDERCYVRDHVDMFHSFVCEIHDRYHAQKPKKAVLEAMPNFVALAQVHPPFFKLPVPDEDQIKACPCGEEFARVFCDWISSLRWGHGRPISGVELYFAFAYATQCLVPVQTSKWKDGHAVFELRHRSVEADQFKLDLSRQSRIWLKMLKWWLTAADIPHKMASHRSLREFGHWVSIQGFDIRPVLPDGPLVGRMLWDYFHENGVTVRSLNRPWKPPRVAAGGG